MNLLFARVVYVLERGKINHLLATNYFGKLGCVKYWDCALCKHHILSVLYLSDFWNLKWNQPLAMPLLYLFTVHFFCPVPGHWCHLLRWSCMLVFVTYIRCSASSVFTAGSSYELSVRVFLRWNSSLRLLLSVQCRTTQSGLNQHFPADSVISWCLACLCHHLEKMSSFS